MAIWVCKDKYTLVVRLHSLLELLPYLFETESMWQVDEGHKGHLPSLFVVQILSDSVRKMLAANGR